ncbi:MAG: hypothetical protein HGA87_05625 [Desulfobulbaceae bacterium]|nr:hypothetical protein [Desulfobulbaceae bacterium]
MRISLLLIALSLTCCLVQAKALDPSELKLPPELKASLSAKFPGYRLARVSDYFKRDIDQHKKDHNGNPCPGIDSADVDGDGFLDFAFFLTNNGKYTILVCARNPFGKFWQISTLYDFGKNGPGNSYVEFLKADSYQDLFDSNEAGLSEYTPEPGRVRKFKANHPGFMAGTFESSGIAFFFTGKRWVHLWLSD